MKRIHDQEILNAIRTGDNASALNGLYRRVLPTVQKFVLGNNGSVDDANDIFQDAVIIFYNHVKQNRFDDQKEIGGFIFSVARNLWINKAKRENKMVKTNDFIEGEDVDADILTNLLTEEKVRAIEAVMEKVGSECKKLLTYSIYDKLSLKEISIKMGFSSDQVAKTYKYRCKQKLFNLVKDNPYILSLFRQ